VDALERERFLDEGAARLEAAILEAQLLDGTDGFWAAALDVERIRVEVEAAAGVSLCEAAPPRAVDAALACAAEVTAEQALKCLESS